ncbi:hypothetical protein [Methanoregula sp.]|uniref:hypothetical protein n=1 Tax=Methanoregula sp. TaxID=2052170 RepID=UPI0026092023|nr:hypothetical protein [Methanoregula sp.]MDD5144064.1 hypothetical protein [Methanoregula sp.]
MLATILLLALVAGVTGDESCSFVKPWPYTAGSGTVPPDISIDPSGAVYVTSPEDGRVFRYSPERELTTYWVLNDTESGVSVVPAGIVADASHNVYVTDRKNSTVIKLSLFKTELWGREGSGNGEFDHPAGIAVDSSGTVYVADAGNNRVQKIHSGGKYLLQWGSYGTARGVFNAPGSIAIDARDHVYVTDAGNSRIQKFTSDGTALAEWGSKGTGAGQFLTPSGVAVDKWGNVYVADQTARVQKFSPTGEYFSTCNTSKTAYDVAIGPSGELFVIMQSGSSWEIGEFRYSSFVVQETPVQRSTFAVLVPRTPSVSMTPGASDTPRQRISVQSPEPGKTVLTISPEVSAENNTSATQIPATLEMPETGTADNRREEGTLVAGREPGAFDRISRFLRSVFEMRIPFLP